MQSLRVGKNGTGEVIEKKSRFIANIFNIENEDDAVSIINSVKKKYWEARHNCYAYVLGNDNQIQRFSDDGEPSGTAGKPILEVLDGSGVRNCLIIVTRYFGGVLLGTGGLVRAYQGAAKEGLANTELLEVEEGYLVEIVTDYNNVGKLQYICAEMQLGINDTVYADNVIMKLLVSKDVFGLFNSRITDAFSGKITPEMLGEVLFCRNGSECGIIKYLE